MKKTVLFMMLMLSGCDAIMQAVAPAKYCVQVNSGSGGSGVACCEKMADDGYCGKHLEKCGDNISEIFCAHNVYVVK